MNYCFRYLLVVLVFWGAIPAAAQDSVWTLARCLQYAKENNISIQEKVISERQARLQYEAGKLSILPNISVSPTAGWSFGRSINPTTNGFVNTSYNYSGLSGNGNVLLFGWFQKHNTNRKNDLLHQAAQADLAQLKNDVSLNVLTGYLRILLAREQIKISEHQLQVSSNQVTQTEILLQAGRSNGLDMAQVKTQAATDTGNYYKALLAYQQSAIDLKAILNFNLAAAFVPEGIEINDVSLQDAMGLNPEEIYSVAVRHFGLIKSDSLKIESVRKDIATARSLLYPQLSLSASTGTNYSSTFLQTLPNGETQVMPWGRQIRNNISQSVYLGLSIPIFNGLSSRYTIKQAKLNMQHSILQSKEDALKLKQAIYTACNEAHTALQTYLAAKSTLAAATVGSDFAGKRYEKGLINAFELITARQTAFKAQTDMVSAQYDLIFKRKVIDYYLGKNWKE